MSPAARGLLTALLLVAWLGLGPKMLDAATWPWQRRDPPPESPHPAVVRVLAEEPDGIAQGSGTLIDVREQFGLVITNWHVVRNASGAVNVVFPDGFQSAARVVRSDRDWDLAALLIWRPRVAPVPLANNAPRPGDPLVIAGYGSGAYRSAPGQCTQYLAPGVEHPFEIVEVSTAARQGDSGGPIFNSRRELAGVLFGSDGGSTSGSYAGRVRQFLEPVWGAGSAGPRPNPVRYTRCRTRQRLASVQCVPVAPVAPHSATTTGGDVPPVRPPTARQSARLDPSDTISLAPLPARAGTIDRDTRFRRANHSLGTRSFRIGRRFRRGHVARTSPVGPSTSKSKRYWPSSAWRPYSCNSAAFCSRNANRTSLPVALRHQTRSDAAQQADGLPSRSLVKTYPTVTKSQSLTVRQSDMSPRGICGSRFDQIKVLSMLTGTNGIGRWVLSIVVAAWGEATALAQPAPAGTVGFADSVRDEPLSSYLGHSRVVRRSDPSRPAAAGRSRGMAGIAWPESPRTDRDRAPLRSNRRHTPRR